MKRFRAFIVFGVPAWMPADTQMNHGSSNAHVQFPTGKSEQTIMMSLYDVMRISHAIEGGNYKRRAQPNIRALLSGCSGTKHLGLLASHRPSTSAVSVPLKEKSIIRMDSVT